eukprot:COSAG02_NODE_18197_length_954_cov_1.141520_2_plen_37_part_01
MTSRILVAAQALRPRLRAAGARVLAPMPGALGWRTHL